LSTFCFSIEQTSQEVPAFPILKLVGGWEQLLTPRFKQLVHVGDNDVPNGFFRTPDRSQIGDVLLVILRLDHAPVDLHYIGSAVFEDAGFASGCNGRAWP
jgi:hypothetical protein